MIVEYLPEPFPHIILKQFFEPNELKDVWKELDFLTNESNFLGPEEAGTARHADGTPKKKNSCIWMNQFYSKLENSYILKYSRKMFDRDLIQVMINSNYIFRYYFYSNYDTTLLSYYEDSDYYEPHRDDYSLLTNLLYLFKEPKQFSGGDLFFPEHNNYTIIPENNKMIIIPSVAEHGVTEIKMNNNIPKFSGYGRYCLSTFVNIAYKEE